MFTGIVEETGVVKGIVPSGALKKIELSADVVIKGAKLGDSISVNGICLTITKIGKASLIFDVMKETSKKTNLEYLRAGDKVNLERSLKMGDPISGHFVYGHVDGVRKILDFDKDEKKSFIDIEISENDAKYVALKGSIAIDGISLTIGGVFKDKVRMFLIPHTLKNTILLSKKIGNLVNVEFDMLAKYLDRKVSLGKPVNESLLKKTGFI